MSFLEKYFARTNKSRDKGTWIKSGAEESKFSQSDKKSDGESTANDELANYPVWYKPQPAASTPLKKFRFSEDTKAPPPKTPPKPKGADFELGQSIVYNNGSSNIEAVVYEGASDD
ncbi:hypothetical protein ACHAWF_013390 [Thalassiosira exigua]